MAAERTEIGRLLTEALQFTELGTAFAPIASILTEAPKDDSCAAALRKLWQSSVFRKIVGDPIGIPMNNVIPPTAMFLFGLSIGNTLIKSNPRKCVTIPVVTEETFEQIGVQMDSVEPPSAEELERKMHSVEDLLNTLSEDGNQILAAVLLLNTHVHGCKDFLLGGLMMYQLLREQIINDGLAAVQATEGQKDGSTSQHAS